MPKKNTVKDGWHKILNNEVYVKDGIVQKVEKVDRHGYSTPAHIYISDGPRTRSYTNIGNSGIKFSTLRSGLYKGTYRIS